MLIAGLLRRGGFEVAEVSDHGVALATLVNQPDVSAVVASFSTAGSGASLRMVDAIRVHQTPTVRDVRVLLILDQPRQQLLAWQARVDGTLVRPYHESELLTELTELVERPEKDRRDHRERMVHRLSNTDPSASERTGIVFH